MRKSGRTTRAVDRFIQCLFSDGHVIVTDHHGTHAADVRTFQIAVDRLKLEHPDVQIEVDRGRQSIKIIQAQD